MSVTGISQDQPDRLLKKSFHRRNDSGELDVFEAARYFSGYNEALGGYNGSSFTQKMMKEDNSRGLRGGRISLDMPNIRHVLNNPHQVVNNMDHHKQMMINNNNNNKDKKYKQPSSPGGRLASFLNSLFSQSASRKKKSKPSSSTQSMKDGHHDTLEESPGGRRKRRSSISHFRSSSTADSKSSIYSSSSSGFRTPPAYAQTPTKSYKDFKNFAKQNNNNNTTSSTTTTTTCSSTTSTNGTHAVKPNTTSTATTTTTTNDHQDRVEESNTREVHKESKSLGYSVNALMSSEKDKVNWVAHDQKYSSDLVEVKRLGLLRRFDDDDDDDDGADSDSSSDLFELQNYDLGCYSSGLPVYETTNMDSIKRGPPISNASM